MILLSYFRYINWFLIKFCLEIYWSLWLMPWESLGYSHLERIQKSRSCIQKLKPINYCIFSHKIFILRFSSYLLTRFMKLKKNSDSWILIPEFRSQNQYPLLGTLGIAQSCKKIVGWVQYSSVKYFFLLFASLASFSNETLREGGSLKKLDLTKSFSLNWTLLRLGCAPLHPIYL